MAAYIEAVHPVLPTRNVSDAVSFYVDKLGFTLLFQDQSDNPGYAGIGRGGVELHFQWHDASEWSRVERPSLRFKISQVDALFHEYETKEVFHTNTSLRDTAWNTREFAFFDPDMNGLTFYEDSSSINSGD